MTDFRDLAEALRPKVAELAREIAPTVRAEAAQSGHAGTYEGMFALCLEGVLHQELRRALEEVKA